jgi:hypothetical protein
MASTWTALTFYLYGKSCTSWYSTQFSRQRAAPEYIHPSLLAVVAFQDCPRKAEIRASLTAPENNVLAILVSLFFAETL